jgi:8-oxo-dGTP pyrophosphatase MutT (NUDIX family)
MPGPVAPWAYIDPSLRILNISQLSQYIKHLSVLPPSQDILTSAEIEETDEFASRPSAVLAPFITSESDSIDSVIVMTRTMKVSHHKGQVSFPGGMVEDVDSDVIDTALRETAEEIGISKEHFTILGTMEPVSTRSRVANITPVVAHASTDILGSIVISPDEVEQVHIIDIEQLVAPDHYMSEVWDFGSIAATIHMYFVHDQQGQPVFIWGATAHMLTAILHCLNREVVK